MCLSPSASTALRLSITSRRLAPPHMSPVSWHLCRPSPLPPGCCPLTPGQPPAWAPRPLLHSPRGIFIQHPPTHLAPCKHPLGAWRGPASALLWTRQPHWPLSCTSNSSRPFSSLERGPGLPSPPHPVLAPQPHWLQGVPEFSRHDSPVCWGRRSAWARPQGAGPPLTPPHVGLAAHPACGSFPSKYLQKWTVVPRSVAAPTLPAWPPSPVDCISILVKSKTILWSAGP